MLHLLERNIGSAGDRLVILAPPDARPKGFVNAVADGDRYHHFLEELQRLRGDIYLRDGALKPEQLSADGRHETPEDARSWHVLVVDERQHVTGCIWYLQHPGLPTFAQLRAHHSALARQPEWGRRLKAAVESDVASARRERVHYAEVGGWAVARNSRLTDCLLLVLSTYGLSQTLGGAFVIATATVRHASAAVLRRLGGRSLAGDGYVVPRYFDPAYNCEMELLRFDTRRPNARFAHIVDYLRGKLDAIPVFLGAGSTRHHSRFAVPLVAPPPAAA